MINGLNFVMLHVPDVAAARGFYTEQLGFAVEDEAPGFVQFKAPGGGASLAIGTASDQEPVGEVELWWFVDDADATFATLAARQLPIVMPPTDMPFGRAFAVQDPAGHTLRMLQLPARG